MESFFTTPTDCTKVSNIISSLNQDKSDGPNSIPNKILKLLNKDISNQLAIFSTNLFSLEYFLQFWKREKLFQYTKKVLN